MGLTRNDAITTPMTSAPRNEYRLSLAVTSAPSTNWLPYWL